MSRLIDIAYARSGDKGSHANIGVIAYNEAGYQFLLNTLTSEKVAAFLSPLGHKGVTRYELPKLHALNFVVNGVLIGGGSYSLRIDNQGKTLGQALLQMPIEPTDGSLTELMRKD